jgi:hypothetical protein
MNEAQPLRVRLTRLGSRVLAAGLLVAMVVAVGLVIKRLPIGNGGSTVPPPAAKPSPWGVVQQGYQRIDAPVARALRQLPVAVALPQSAGSPAGVYSTSYGARVRYGADSQYGLFLLTVSGRRHSIRPRGVRALAKGCRSCSVNRLVALGGGVEAAVMVGGGRPTTVTWLQRGRSYEVRGPAGTFTETDALRAARAISHANA